MHENDGYMLQLDLLGLRRILFKTKSQWGRHSTVQIVDSGRDCSKMSDNPSGLASLPLSLDETPLPDPDDDFLDLNEGAKDDPTKFVKPGKDGLEKGGSPDVPEYILGTLVVRVVAARDLEVGGACERGCNLLLYR
jgi:hypothetical protein